MGSSLRDHLCTSARYDPEPAGSQDSGQCDVCHPQDSRESLVQKAGFDCSSYSLILIRLCHVHPSLHLGNSYTVLFGFLGLHKSTLDQLKIPTPLNADLKLAACFPPEAGRLVS